MLVDTSLGSPLVDALCRYAVDEQVGYVQDTERLWLRVFDGDVETAACWAETGMRAPEVAARLAAYGLRPEWAKLSVPFEPAPERQQATDPSSTPSLVEQLNRGTILPESAIIAMGRIGAEGVAGALSALLNRGSMRRVNGMVERGARDVGTRLVVEPTPTGYDIIVQGAGRGSRRMTLETAMRRILELHG